MPKTKDKTMCSGCHDDFYNHHYAQDGCWHFKRAKVVERMRVGVWQNPPYHWRPQATLSCYHPEGSVMIKKDDSRVIIDSVEATHAQD